MGELVLKSQNALEAKNNVNRIGKSLVDFFKNACVHPSIKPENMSFEVQSERAYTNDEGYADDYKKYLTQEKAVITFSDKPSLILNKYMNSEFHCETVKTEKTRKELDREDRRLKFWRGKKFYNTKKTFTLKSCNPECSISHGGILLEISEEQFDLLFHFLKEQKETKVMNNEIDSLSKRLDDYGIVNPLK